ncbi:hypothetical protein, partial [Brachyspira catarrhinii]|uniref:hypothetical protein n=1 Tax=Brachyspira catarrhinii TaxID=2528966 RepID=UPI001F2CE6A5
KQSKACIVSLTNNLNFYIPQFFKALYFFFYKENESSCSFFYREKRTKKAISFLSKKKQKTTPFRIRNSLIKIFSQYLESLSLRGFIKNRSNPIYLDCHAYARNDNYFYSSLRGFAEAIYSIVDCFIT